MSCELASSLLSFSRVSRLRDASPRILRLSFYLFCCYFLSCRMRSSCSRIFFSLIFSSKSCLNPRIPCSCLGSSPFHSPSFPSFRSSSFKLSNAIISHHPNSHSTSPNSHRPHLHHPTSNPKHQSNSLAFLHIPIFSLYTSYKSMTLVATEVILCLFDGIQSSEGLEVVAHNLHFVCRHSMGVPLGAFLGVSGPLGLWLLYINLISIVLRCFHVLAHLP